ncbi:MAG: hypothetical protein FWC47_06950 [Oscillospiraceae bacterium]|nr:hypothetical protein [Oscillospiraceae bacterium]
MDDVITIRTNDEAKARFKEFVKQGDFRNQDELFKHLLTLYEMQETGFRVSSLEKAVSAVNELSDRIAKIIIGVGNITLVNEEKLLEEKNKIRTEAEDKIQGITSEYEKVKLEVETKEGIIKDIQEKYNKSQEQIKSINLSLVDKSALNDQYYLRITNLETEINKNKILVEGANDKLAEFSKLHQDFKEQSILLAQKDIEKEKAIIEISDSFKDEIDKLKSENLKELEKLRYDIQEQSIKLTQKDLEMEKALMEQEKLLRQENNELEKLLRQENNELKNELTRVTTDYERKLIEKDKESIEREKKFMSEINAERETIQSEILSKTKK